MLSSQRLCAGLLLCAAAGAAQASVVYGSNLIVNGDAESGTDGWLGYDVYSVIQSVPYGSNWVRPEQPGPPDRGSFMFAGTGAYAVAYQMFNLGVATAAPLAFTLSGWLGGWQAQGDNALLYASFIDGSDAEIGAAAIGPVLPADRNDSTGLFYRELIDWLPQGTTQVAFWLSMERQGGGDNDGYADNLSFVLQAPAAVSEPSPLALLATAALALTWLRRRKG